MSKRTKYSIDVVLPTPAEFAYRFPQYGPRAHGEGRPYFDLVMNTETFVAASVLTRIVQAPAVTAVAASALELAGGEITGTDKQFVGALMCCLMEHNGFEKTHRKGSVPHPAWNRGEVYAET